jgi:hypothetical protein
MTLDKSCFLDEDPFDITNAERPNDFWVSRLKALIKKGVSTIPANPPLAYGEPLLEAIVSQELIRVGDTIELFRENGFESSDFLRVEVIKRAPSGEYLFSGFRLARSRYFPVDNSYINELTKIVLRRKTRNGSNVALETILQSKVKKLRANVVYTNNPYPVDNPARDYLAVVSDLVDLDFDSVKEDIRNEGKLVVRTVCEFAEVIKDPQSYLIDIQVTMRRLFGRETDTGFDNTVYQDSCFPLEWSQINASERFTYVSGFCGGGTHPTLTLI